MRNLIASRNAITELKEGFNSGGGHAYVYICVCVYIYVCVSKVQHSLS